MEVKWTCLVVFATEALLASSAQAEPLCAAPWKRLEQNAREVARPLPLALVGASALPPILMSPTNADYTLRVWNQSDLGGSYSPERVSIFAPYLFLPASVIFYTGAALTDWCPGQTRGAAMVQGLSETLLVIGLTKWTTGRIWPLAGRAPEDPEVLEHPEDGRTWRPFQEGLGAFPSGHTAFFFAAASAFRASSPDIGLWRYAGYPFAAAMGFAMWYGDHHWASDVISGALLGEAIGGAAGRTWADGGEQPAVAFVLLPTGAGWMGVASGQF